MKKKIIFIVPTFRRGGVERVTLNILNLLDCKLFEVILIICVKDKNVLKDYLPKNVQVKEFNKPNVRKALFPLFSILNKEKPDLVFTSFIHLSLPVLVYKYLLFKKYKTIIRLSSLPSNKLKANWKSPIYAYFFGKFLTKADAIISQSKEMTIDVKQFYAINKDKIHTIPNPVNVKQIRELAQEESIINMNSSCFNIVTIGSLSEVKGYDLLIDAFHNIKKKGVENYRLYIIGDNRSKSINYKQILLSQIQNLGLEENVFLLGFHSNPYNILNQADAFVLSSRKEGFPNVVLEALALSKPCVVTNCIDLSEFINKGSGVIVQKESVEALTEGLLQVKHIKGKDMTFKNFDYNSWLSRLKNNL